jgi:hypothetical protein
MIKLRYQQPNFDPDQSQTEMTACRAAYAAECPELRE